MQDVVRAVAELPDSESLLSSLVEQLPIAIFDMEMRYLAVSPHFLSNMARLTSAETSVPADVIGRSLYETFPKLPVRWREINSLVLAGEKLAEAEREEMVHRQDGGMEWVRWSVGPWRTADGRIGGILVSGEIITEQVKTKHALAQSEARFRATFDDSTVGIAHLSPDGRYVRANEALCRILGYPLDELLTKSIHDLTYPDDLAVELAYFEQMRDGRIDNFDLEKRYLRKDSRYVWTRLNVRGVRMDEGSIDYFVVMLEDISARKQAEKELRENERRFRLSLIHSPLPILLFDDREHILVVSESWLEQTGYLREEIRRLEDWTIRAFRERSDIMLEKIRQFMVVSTVPPETRSGEHMIRTKDGRERRWRFITSDLPYGVDGPRLFISVAQDVTDQKAHEEQVHLLMREIDHRARNMLSLVLAIARQTAARKPADFLERFTGRIQALAANQELLRQNEWQGVDVEDLVRAELAHFADLVGSRITALGPKLRLNPAAAQALGLALHELATNAGRYGALSTEAGRVDVGWQSEGDVFAMNWTERDGPPVRPPERKGFGSTVIESMAGRALSAEVQFDYAPLGVVWRLNCPAAHALEWTAKPASKSSNAPRPAKPSPTRRSRRSSTRR
jgi:PAS domain S-box-containing protein